jgi:ferredoxin
MPDSVEDFELDMLELAKEYDQDPDASRLSCQVVLTEELEGLTVKLPSSHTNYMDHLPFE